MQSKSQKSNLVRLGGQILVSVAVVFAFNYFQHSQNLSNQRGVTITEFNSKTPAIQLVGDCEKPGGC